MSQLYQAHSRRVYAVVRRLAGDDDLAADLSQDAWVRAFERLHLYRGEAAFGTWMHRLATNVALNRLRRRTQRPDVEASAVGMRTHVKPSDEAVMSRRVLSDALDKLPDGYRRVLVMHDVEGWTHDEIGKSLGIASGTSKSQLHKARARMRQLIAPSAAATEAGNGLQ
jgi:RNA polymerase sigma-70 factor (ECF subfamily)